MGLSLPKSNLNFKKKCLDKWVHFKIMLTTPSYVIYLPYHNPINVKFLHVKMGNLCFYLLVFQQVPIMEY